MMQTCLSTCFYFLWPFRNVDSCSSSHLPFGRIIKSNGFLLIFLYFFLYFSLFCCSFFSNVNSVRLLSLNPNARTSFFDGLINQLLRDFPFLFIAQFVSLIALNNFHPKMFSIVSKNTLNCLSSKGFLFIR